MRRIAILLLAILPAFAWPADKKPALPAWFPAPGNLFKVDDLKYTDYDYWDFLDLDESPIPKNSGGYRPVAGRIWKFGMVDPSPDAWMGLRSLLEKQGFRMAYGDRTDTNPGMASLQKGEGDHATYIEYWNHNSIAIIEIAPNPFHLTLEPPADKPEKIGAHGDIPYLAPIPGSKTTYAMNDRPGGITVAPACGKPDGDKVPDENFGTRRTERTYDGPRTLSAYATQEVYESALRAAGWDQVCQLPGTGAVDAHYTRNGRDIWARLRQNGEPWHYELTVADAGSGLREDLKKDCKAALYGVNFDFDKATLRPDSEPALNQVLALMKDEPKLAVEIGGHTDNVGKPEYNAKLSDARAASVVQWLVQHGIAASRLSSHGYGDTQPLVPNDSDEDRAKNRRVELKRKGCK